MRVVPGEKGCVLQVRTTICLSSGGLDIIQPLSPLAAAASNALLTDADKCKMQFGLFVKGLFTRVMPTMPCFVRDFRDKSANK